MTTGPPWSDDDVYDLVLLFYLSSVLSVVGLYEQPYISLIALGSHRATLRVFQYADDLGTSCT